MKTEQDIQALSLSKNGKQSEQLISADIDEVSESKNKGLNLRPLLRTIRRNILLISGITGVVAVAALYSSLNAPISYQGNFRLLVEPVTSEAKYTDPAVLSRDGAGVTDTGLDYPTLLAVLESPGLLSKITKQIQAKYPNVNYEALKFGLEVQRVGTNLADATKLIEVTYSGEDPKEVVFILEEVAKGYLDYSLDYRKTRINSGVQFIEDQLPTIQQQVDALEGALQTLQQQYMLSDPASEGVALSQQLREIEAQKLQVQRELREQKALYALLQRQLKLTPNEAMVASTTSEDTNYQQLVAQQKKIENQIAIESARFKEDSPTLQLLREQQRQISQLLSQENKKITEQDLGSTTVKPQVLAFQNSLRQGLIKQLVDATNQTQLLEVRNQAIAQTQAFLSQQVRQFPVIRRQYDDLKRRLEIATNTLNQLLVQRETLRVEAAQKEIPWEIISEPNIPRDLAGNLIADSDSPSKKLALGIAGGFLLALGVAMLKEKYRNIFYTPEDIQDAIEVSLLGVSPFDESIKQFAIKSTETADPRHVPSYVFKEAYKSLYANVSFLSDVPNVRSLVVSSAAPGDGKTTVAWNLAQTAAAMGQRVLLVDANFYLPQIQTQLDLPDSQGLSNILGQNLDAMSLIQRWPEENNLYVLTSGTLLADSNRLLASTKMQHLMAQLQAAFDLVIYDTPHILGITDTYFLAAHTDGVIVVAGVGKTRRSAFMQAIDELNSLRLPILGVVANHLEEGTLQGQSYPSLHHELDRNSFATST